MEKKDKTKIEGISLIGTGCLLVASVFWILVTWKVVILIISIGSGYYLIYLGINHLKRTEEPVDKVQKGAKQD